MNTLDMVAQLQSRGMPDSEIIKILKDEGVQPQEIKEALNQAKVKAAVSQTEEQEEDKIKSTPFEMRQSIMKDIPSPPSPTESLDMRLPSPSPQQSQKPPTYPDQQNYSQKYGGEQNIKTTPPPSQEATQPPYPEQDYYQNYEQQSYPEIPDLQQQEYPNNTPNETEQYSDYYTETPQSYPEEAYYPQQQGADTNTIAEIAEQIVLEKFDEFKEKTGDLSLLKNKIQDKLKDLDKRLTKLEDSTEKLQQAIIGKIGEFGHTTKTIHKDLDNLHNTVSKLMNPLIDNYRELKKIAGRKKSTS